MKTHKIIFLLIFLAINSYNTYSQSFINTVNHNLNVYNSQKPTEKIYLHLDKTLYGQGDYIFYKLYLTEGLTNTLNPVSRFAYVELIDPKGSTIETHNLLVSSGMTNGFFEIDSYFKGGLYKIRAYTTWQRNFENPAVFEKEIVIQKVITPNVLLKIDFDKESYGSGDEVTTEVSVKNLYNLPVRNHPVTTKIFLAGKLYKELNLTTNPDGKLQIKYRLPQNLATNDGIINVQLKYNEQTEAITRAIPIVLNKIDVTFFPEGGYIVAGTKNRIAFEALNEFGLPADVQGIITDETGKTITEFSSFHQGMGAFSFVPEKNMRYKAQITSPFKLDTLFSLPKSRNTGFVLSYQNTENQNLCFDIFSDKTTTVYLTATERDSMFFCKEISLDKGQNTVLIPDQNFTDGIIRVTLFNNSGMPECERLIYHGKIVPLKIDVEVEKEDFLREESTEIKITTSYNDKPVSANLSMAMVDDKNITFADDKQDNILSWMLMSSEIKGKIYEPSFYFDPQEQKARKALDFVLMTHGWRRFSWAEVLNEQPNVSFAAEKDTTVFGQVVSCKNGEGVQTQVWLFELENNHRAATLKTDTNGFFAFTDVDPASKLVLMAKCKRKKSKKIKFLILNDKKSQYTDFFGYNDRTGANLNLPTEIQIKNNSENLVQNFNYIINSDIPRYASQCVVTAMGISKKTLRTGHNATRIYNQQLNTGLRGKMSGLNITHTSGAVGANTQVTLRGTSSYNTDAPLMLIDGVPVSSNSFNNNTDFGCYATYISPIDINDIIIVKGPQATAIYGSRAANGVMVFSTKNYYHSRRKPRIFRLKSKYCVHNLDEMLQKEYQSTAKEYYSSKEYWKEQNSADNSNATVYWNAQIKTDKNGKATIPVYCPPKVSSYKITVEGISQNGKVGRGTNNLNVIKPVNIQTKVPYELSYNDTMTIPVVLNNTTANEISGIIMITHGEKLTPLNKTEKEVSIPANSSVKELFSFVALPSAGQENIEILFENQRHSDKLKYDLTIYPKGFEVEKSFAGTNSSLEFSFALNNPVKNSFNGQFNIYADALADFAKSIESMFRRPSGCFEQVSSTTYPNVLALNYIKENDIRNMLLEQRALDYIKIGYDKIAGYETSRKGFEWYGHTPPHEVLTAYGLLELIEMKKVYPNVDENLIERTQNWLMSRKDGKGNFKQHQGKYGFAGTPQKVANAYIVYALSRAGLRDFEQEYQHAKAEAIKSQDAYRLGLLANAAFYMKKYDDFNNFISILKDVFRDRDFQDVTAEASITRSGKRSLSIETASIYLLALLKEKTHDIKEIERVRYYLFSQKRGGYFGSTQGTIMALSALLEYGLFYKSYTNIDFELTVNGKTTRKHIPYDQLRQFSSDFEKDIETQDSVNVAINFLSNKVPYSFDFKWNALDFKSSEDCKVSLSTSLDQHIAKVGDNVRMNIAIENKTDTGLAMTIAEIGIPAGLSLQPWQLKKLTDEKAWDYYEIFDGKLVIYYVEMAPSEKRSIKLDLKSDIAGNYTSRAGSAYLYYDNEYKDWTKGVNIKILE